MDITQISNVSIGVGILMLEDAHNREAIDDAYEHARGSATLPARGDLHHGLPGSVVLPTSKLDEVAAKNRAI